MTWYRCFVGYRLTATSADDRQTGWLFHKRRGALVTESRVVGLVLGACCSDCEIQISRTLILARRILVSLSIRGLKS